MALLINKRFEERRHLNELMLNAAVRKFEQDTALVIAQMNVGMGPNEIAPIEMYIIRLMKLTEQLSQGPITEETIAKKIQEVQKVTSVAAELLGVSVKKSR